MASDVPSPQGRFLQDAAAKLLPDGKLASSPRLTFAILLLPIVLVYLKKVLYPTYDSREPPVIRPKVPFFGHVVSLARESASFYTRLYKERSLPICTLPMLNGKLYVINSPTLISAAMRNRDLSFDPFSLEFATGALGMLPSHVKIYAQADAMDEVNRIIHASLTGQAVYSMNTAALADGAVVLNAISPNSALEVSDSWIWIRELVGMATMKALYGKNNPITPEAIEMIGMYDEVVVILAMGIMPSLLARKGLAARNKIQNEMLKPFFLARLDLEPDVCELVKQRAAIHRRRDIPDNEISLIEFTVPWVSTTNTIPTLFWFFVNVFTRPDLVARIRGEVAALITITSRPGGRKGTIDVTKLEKGCPLLMACYRETLRLYNANVGNRRVMKDTVLREVDGTEYLLKKGTNVQWAAGVNHMHDGHFGSDVGTFNPDRWIEQSPQQEKKQRIVMIPFGGGKTLCPGRNFALAENLGFMAALAGGFDVEGVQLPPPQDPFPGGAVRRPDWGSMDRSMRIKRRSGWEDVEWEFVC